jgi:ATP-binding cassette subfamily C protein
VTEAGSYLRAAVARPALPWLLIWSIPAALPAAISGAVLARAVDDGFHAGRPAIGSAWLGGLLVAAAAGAVGSRRVFGLLGDLVEPVRDDLVERVVGAALRDATAGRHDAGVLARLTRQTEMVRDSLAGLLLILASFAVTVAGVLLGMLSIAPRALELVLPPFLLGLVGFAATLRTAAARQLAAVRAEERLAEAAATVFAGTRDVVASGAEEHAAELVAEPVAAQAAAERALAGMAALRALCLAAGGWLPLLLLLLAGPALVRRGLTAGELLGSLTYVLFGLQPALHATVGALGGSGLRLLVTLNRILDTSPQPEPAGPDLTRPEPVRPELAPPEPAPPELAPPAPARPGPARAAADRPALVVAGVTFRYGPRAAPVLRGLHLTVPYGEHLAVIGPSGVGKSTLAALLCGLLRPGTGTITLGGRPAHEAAARRVLIPQQAYVFTGTVTANLTYLNPYATPAEIEWAAQAVGAAELLGRLGDRVRPAELSAGERQLIALVRAYLSAAPVVILDEATCHLDPAAERRAEEAFAARPGTLIVIAHRISSALRADRILLLDGETSTVGDHATLLAGASPLYRELLGHWTPPVPASSARAAGWPVS